MRRITCWIDSHDLDVESIRKKLEHLARSEGLVLSVVAVDELVGDEK